MASKGRVPVEPTTTRVSRQEATLARLGCQHRCDPCRELHRSPGRTTVGAPTRRAARCGGARHRVRRLRKVHRQPQLAAATGVVGVLDRRRATQPGVVAVRHSLGVRSCGQPSTVQHAETGDELRHALAVRRILVREVHQEQPLLRVDLDQEHDQARHDGQAPPGRARQGALSRRSSPASPCRSDAASPRTAPGYGAGDRHRPRVRCSTTSPARSRAHIAKAVEAISTARPRNRTQAASTTRFCTKPRPTNRTMEHARNVAAAHVTGLDSARIRSLGACDTLYSAPASHTIRTVPQQATLATITIWSFISTTVMARRLVSRAQCYRPQHAAHRRD